MSNSLISAAPHELAIIAAAFFFAAFAKGTTGLGFSTTCLPFLVYAMGLKAALPLLIVPSIASNIIVMREAGHFKETVWRFWPLFVMALPGVVIGLWLLDSIDAKLAAAVLGLVLVTYCIFALANPHLRLPTGLEKPLAPFVGFATGILNGMTGSQVMPVLPYLLSLNLEPNRFVQAINCSFTLSSVIMAAGLAKLGLLTLETALISACGLVLVWAGIKLGSRVRNLLSPEVFRVTILVFLMVLGASLAIRWLGLF